MYGHLLYAPPSDCYQDYSGGCSESDWTYSSEHGRIDESFSLKVNRECIEDGSMGIRTIQEIMARGKKMARFAAIVSK